MRYLKITLSGTALFFLYLWVSILLNSCNNNKPVYQEEGDNVELTTEEMGEIDYTSSDEFEGEEGDDGYDDSDTEMNTTVDDGSSEEEEVDDYVAGDYTASSEKTRLEPRKKPTKKVENERTFEATPSSTSSGSSYGDYMVIAGSYLLEDNARKMIRKLQGMGYNNAEIVYFDQSQYHSICAGRYDSKSTAKETSSRLKGNGIDSYVHRKQD